MGITQRVGSLGEELAVKFLMKREFTILDRNYRRPWGELDIVVKKGGKIHFVEVKALSQNIVSDETLPLGNREVSRSYIRAKVKKDRFSPEEHMTPEKLKRLGRIIQTYLGEKHVSSETKWQFDVLTVLVDRESKKAKVEFLEDIIL